MQLVATIISGVHSPSTLVVSNTMALLLFAVSQRAAVAKSLLKKRSENVGANENLSRGFPSIPGIAPGVAPRILVFVLFKSWDAIPRMDFRIPRMEFLIPRVAPTIAWNSPRAPRMAFMLRELFS